MANDEEFQQRLLEAFQIEAQEHLQMLSAGLLELESSPAEERRHEIVETIFREAHSLKGAARSVNRTDIESLCQAMESVFSKWKTNGVTATAETFDRLSDAVDFLQRLLGATPPDAREVAAMTKEIRALETMVEPLPESMTEPVDPGFSAHPVAHVTEDTIRIATAKMDALLLQAEEMIAVKNTATQRASELHEVAAMMETWRKEWAKMNAEMQRVRAPAQNSSAPTERVFDFLEWNQSYLRSLENRLLTLRKSAEEDQRRLGGMVDDLLDEAKRLVMLPFATLLDIFPKPVRDLARDQEKQVELILRGRRIEIDKRILEQMKDPLMHLVRNAIDHGIEKPEMRMAQRKPERGMITMAVAQIDASKVEIVIGDDGAGIDVAEVKAAAVKSGAISTEEAAQRSDREALALIFQSGVSTSKMVTELSGRGLGMAIVREKVEKLGGHIEIETERGRGTAFRIVLPVTLSTFKGLLVRAGGQPFVLPIANVDRVLRIARDEIKTVENKETISWDGRVLSLTRLNVVLGLPRREKSEDSKFVQMVVLNAGETRIAFVVDEVLNEQEVLVKPLQKPLVHVRNVAAATVLGSGQVVLILNVPELIESATTGTANAVSAIVAEPVESKTKSLLVVDDSVTSRMLLKNILETAGYDVKTAIDGVDAMTHLRTQHFDLIVSDVQMPRMDGFDLTAKIRTDKRLGDLPVVLVTALESREHRERGIDVGANAYIVKSSFDQSNLLEVVEHLI